MIAAALSIQDPRSVPRSSARPPTRLHRRFDVPGSDLLSIVALWDHLREQQRALSGNQFRRLCRAEFLNYLRVREWQDLFSQLRQVAGDLGHPRQGPRPAIRIASTSRCSPAAVAHRDPRRRSPRASAARAGRCSSIAPGSVLAKRSPRWVMAGELVETNRIWARRVAAIDPAWVERIGAHLVRRSYGEPRWDERRGAAVTTETVTLYGLPVVTARTVPYDRVDAAAARAMFIRHALVQGEWDDAPRLRRPQRDVPRACAGDGGPGPLRRAARRRRAVRLLRRPSRRRTSTSGRRFDQWWKAAGVSQPALLDLTEERRSPAAVHLADYPDTWRHGDLSPAAVVPLRPGRAARRRQRARPAHGAQPDRRHRLRLADPRLPGRARRGARAHAAQGRPPAADPDGRDSARQRRSDSARQRAGSSTRWPRRWAR